MMGRQRRHLCDPVLFGKRQKFLVYLLVANTVRECVDSPAHQLLGLLQVEDVRNHFYVLFVRLIDDRPVNLRQKHGKCSQSVVQPELQHGGILGRFVARHLPRLLRRCRSVDLSRGPAVFCAEPLRG